MISTILNRIDRLFLNGAFHKKRGFCITEQPTDRVGVHLIEESTELLAELMDGSDSTVLEEAADVLICLTRIIYDRKIEPEALQQVVIRKMNDIWVYDPNDIASKDPGFTRRNRI